MEHNRPREVGLREARSKLADLVTDAAVRGTITYLTNRGRRVAAVVPVSVAETAEAVRQMAGRPSEPFTITDANSPYRNCAVTGADGTVHPIPDSPQGGES